MLYITRLVALTYNARTPEAEAEGLACTTK